MEVTRPGKHTQNELERSTIACSWGNPRHFDWVMASIAMFNITRLGKLNGLHFMKSLDPSDPSLKKTGMIQPDHPILHGLLSESVLGCAAAS